MAEAKRKSTAKKTAAKKTNAKTTNTSNHIGIVQRDPWLEPFEHAIVGRHEHAEWMIGHLTNNGKMSLSDFATGYMYYGLHQTDKGTWVEENIED